MKFNKLTFEYVLLICLLQTKYSNGAKILGFFSTSSKSHFILEEPIMRELARRGHEVTVVTAFSQSGEPLENYRYIELPEALEIDHFLTNFASDALQSADKKSSFTKIFTIMSNIVGTSLHFLRHPKFQTLKNEKFDLLVLGWFVNEYTLGLSGHFHCPSIIITPNINSYAIRKLSGGSASVSTIPSPLLTITSEMLFFDRIVNFLAYIAECVMSEVIFYFYMLPFYNEEFPPDQYPSYEEVLQNVSLVLLTQHFSGRTPEALLPNVIEVEGMHVKKEPSPLPTDFSAINRAIFFNFGSKLLRALICQKTFSQYISKHQAKSATEI